MLWSRERRSAASPSSWYTKPSRRDNPIATQPSADIQRVRSIDNKNRRTTLARAAATAANEKNGTEIVILDVSSVTSIADYFVITAGANHRQVRAISEHIEDCLKGTAHNQKPIRREGMEDARWVLLDYGDLLVHVLLEEERAHYNLERLWADAPLVSWEPDIDRTST